MTLSGSGLAGRFRFIVRFGFGTLQYCRSSMISQRWIQHSQVIVPRMLRSLFRIDSASGLGRNIPVLAGAVLLSGSPCADLPGKSEWECGDLLLPETGDWLMSILGANEPETMTVMMILMVIITMIIMMVKVMITMIIMMVKVMIRIKIL